MAEVEELSDEIEMFDFADVFPENEEEWPAIANFLEIVGRASYEELDQFWDGLSREERRWLFHRVIKPIESYRAQHLK